MERMQSGPHVAGERREKQGGGEEKGTWAGGTGRGGGRSMPLGGPTYAWYWQIADAPPLIHEVALWFPAKGLTVSPPPPCSLFYPSGNTHPPHPQSAHLLHLAHPTRSAASIPIA
jgi:hypothetical protein